MELTGTNKPITSHTQLFAPSNGEHTAARVHCSVPEISATTTTRQAGLMVSGVDNSIELRRSWRKGNARLHSEPGS